MNYYFEARVPSVMEILGARADLLVRLGFDIDQSVLEGDHDGTFEVPRDALFEALWSKFTDASGAGLVGIHEGTVLSEQANERGLTTESWTLDSAEAPRERDWIGDSEAVETQFFFSSEEVALSVRALIMDLLGTAEVGEVKAQVQRDWDAEWKASFRGIRVEPDWLVHPPWVDHSTETPDFKGRVLTVLPGAGFGTGTHETTQLCLRLLSQVHREKGKLASEFAALPALDFGSGSGILALAAAQLGHPVDAVEIDPLAIDNAKENARLNHLESLVRFGLTLDQLEPAPAGKYSLIFANILRPVLIEFAPLLLSSWAFDRSGQKGAMILSGLIEKDIEEVRSTYNQVFRGLHSAASTYRPLKWTCLDQGEWRGLLVEVGDQSE